MDTTYVYKRGPGVLEKRGYLGSKPGVCDVSYSYPSPPLEVARLLRASEARTLAKGDHLHSLPFTGSYVEQSPMAGRVSFDYRNTNASGPDKNVCGVSAGSYMSYSGDIGFWIPTPLAPAVPFDDALEQRLKEAADTKALADLRRSYYNLGILLAERRKSISYLTDKCKQLMALVKARQTKDLARYFATRKRDQRRVTRDIANEHLGFLFGLLPLISEIEGAADLLAADSAFKITGRGRQAKVSMSSTASAIRTMTVSATVLPAALDRIDLTTVKYSCRTSVSVEVNVPAAQKLRDHGLNPMATFFDIVPLSFLCDFVSNTGTFVRALDPLVGVTFLTANSTFWRETKIKTSVRAAKYTVTGSSSVQTVVGSGQGESETRNLVVRRVALTDYPEATWQLQNNLSIGKAATLASLAIQRYLKPVRFLVEKKPFRYRGPRPRYLPPIKYR